eukprot:1938752-Pleurochrysis_carterae.AAC.1
MRQTARPVEPRRRTAVRTCRPKVLLGAAAIGQEYRSDLATQRPRDPTPTWPRVHDVDHASRRRSVEAYRSLAAAPHGAFYCQKYCRHPMAKWASRGQVRAMAPTWYRNPSLVIVLHGLWTYGRPPCTMMRRTTLLPDAALEATVTTWPRERNLAKCGDLSFEQSQNNKPYMNVWLSSPRFQGRQVANLGRELLSRLDDAKARQSGC